LRNINSLKVNFAKQNPPLHFKILFPALYIGTLRIFSTMSKSVSLIILILLAGCDIFTPRVAEPPDIISDPYAWIIPNTPELVLDNIANAIKGKSKENYINCLYQDTLASSYNFVPDPSVLQQYSGIFSNWNIQSEETFINSLLNLIPDGSLNQFTWSHIQMLDALTSPIIQADYIMNLSLSSSRDNIPAQSSGTAIFTLQLTQDNIYQIAIWEDLASDTLATISLLKAMLQ
jgi:hypothetical protein